jgi:NAD(P)H-flavin reductase
MLKDFTLIAKKKLTYDIFEMLFESSEFIDFKYWQFITFILPWIWWRAYSILELIDWNKIKLIIKRLENGRWWSKFICDCEVWTILKWVWPAWHFILKETPKNKLFIWTWTWFVPLYNQINGSIELWLKSNLKLIFWLKNELDIFYEKELAELKNKYKNFDFEYYISREKVWNHINWRVTDFLREENIKNFEEFYLCWIPSMIDNSIEILLSLWISMDQIFTEKY